MGSSSPESIYDGWCVKTPNYGGNPRYHLVERKALFKKVRVEGAVRNFIEISNELMCYDLGRKLDIPVIETWLGVLPNQGVGLFSIVLGEQDLGNIDAGTKAKISNIEKLKDLFVFDQWIFNDDRQLRHIKVGSHPFKSNSFLLYGIDHGHTLNGYNGQKWTIDTLSEDIGRTLGPIYFDHGIVRHLETREITSRIQMVSDDEIDKVAGSSVETISKFDANKDELNRVIHNTEIVKKLLKMRRNHLASLIENWCRSTGKIME